MVYFRGCSGLKTVNGLGPFNVLVRTISLGLHIHKLKDTKTINVHTRHPPFLIIGLYKGGSTDGVLLCSTCWTLL